MSYKQYTNLNKYEAYDKEAAEELAEALNERAELQRRLEEVNGLVRDNDQLHPFIWQTAEGNHLALHKIEDEHFKNILTHLARNGRTVSKAIKAEAQRRGLPVPAERRALLPAADEDCFDWWENELDHDD